MKKQNGLRLSACLIIFSWIVLAAVNVFGQWVTKTSKGPCSEHILDSGKRPEDKQKCDIAGKSLRTAALIVTGDDWSNISPTSYPEFTAANELSFDSEYAEKFKMGLTLADAIEWLKKKNANDEEYRTRTINNSYLAVYGREAKPIEKTAWKAQVKNKEVWYQTIAIENVKQLKQSSAARTEGINLAYNISMGRNANPNEIQYWLPLIETVPLLVATNREFLYSPKGTADLLETVNRAYNKLKATNTPGYSSTDSILKESKNYRYIYREMLKPDYKKH